MTSLRLAIVASIVAGLLLPAAANPAFAANECQIKYGWNTGNSLNGTFQNHSTTKNIDAGQTTNINKSRMNYVRNMKNPDVKFYLDNAQDVTLGKNQQNPVAGTYVGNVKLVKAKCLASTGGGSSSGGGAASGSSSTGGVKIKKGNNSGTNCGGGFPDVAKTPSPAGPVPIPYPNINCK